LGVGSGALTSFQLAMPLNYKYVGQSPPWVWQGLTNRVVVSLSTCQSTCAYMRET